MLSSGFDFNVSPTALCHTMRAAWWLKPLGTCPPIRGQKVSRISFSFLSPFYSLVYKWTRLPQSRLVLIFNIGVSAVAAGLFVQDVVMPFYWTEMVKMLGVSKLNTAVSYVVVPLIYLGNI